MALACRHCRLPVRRIGGSRLTEAELPLAKVIHTGTGEESCADGQRLAAPIDVTAPPVKPTPAQLGIDLDAQEWQRSGDADGSIEVAFPDGSWERGDWVLMRKSADQDGRVLLFDRNEWVCFLDGARKGEFDDAAT